MDSKDRETRRIERAAREAGCEPVHHRGSHEKWECPDGSKFGLVKNGRGCKEQNPSDTKRAWDVISRNLENKNVD